MPKAKEKLFNLIVGEISLCDEGDNPRAHTLLWKRRSRTNRRGMAGYDPSKRRLAVKTRLVKLIVETLEQETGGVEKHAHTLELPDGPIGAGTFVTVVTDDHDHDLEIPMDLKVGDSVELVTKSANQELPEGVTVHVHKVRITVRELVERRYDQRMEELQRYLGLKEVSEIDAEVAKRLFDEVRAATVKDQAADAVMRRLGDLADSVRSIFWMFNDDGSERTSDQIEGDLRTSLEQFVSSVGDELPDILSGRIAKLRTDLDKEDDTATVAQALEEMLLKWLDEPIASGSGSKSPGSGSQEGDLVDPKKLDLTKLDDTTRATVETALEAADKAAEQVETLTAKVAELEGKLTEKDKPKDDDDDPYASLPKELQSHLRKRDEELAEARTENLELRQKGERESLVKRCTFKAIAGGDELIDVMVALSEDNRIKLEGILKAADTAAQAGADPTIPLGDDGEGDLGAGASAYAAIEAAAETVRKANPSFTMEKAKTEAMRLDPNLYENYRKELAQASRH